MKMTFRWYGPDDPVSLENISQIPTMTGIVSAVYDVKPGEVWSNESIAKIKNDAKKHGLEFEVVESVPVPEDIKLGNENAERLTENYCENIRRLGKAGVKCICYNFMPVFDWLRSELEFKHPDGANSLAYIHESVLNMDPTTSELSLPGWDASYTKEELNGLIAQYKELGEEGLWKNLETFLKKIIPVAEEAGVNMAIHPDDPPWGMFGLPRIITSAENLRRFLSIVDSKNNGLTFCTGSLAPNIGMDLVDAAREFCDRIHFLHLRNIKYTGDRAFYEVGHPSECGSVDMYGVAKALVEGGFDGYVRPDHGRMIWGEKGRYGYGLFDRALGATYIAGLFEAIEKDQNNAQILLKSRKLPPLKSREEMLEILQREEYGFLPPKPDKISFEVKDNFINGAPVYNFCCAKAMASKVTVNTEIAGKKFSFPMQAVIPTGEGEHPFVVALTFSDQVANNYLPIEEIVDEGFAVLAICYNDVTKDTADFSDGLSGVLYNDGKRNPDSCGKIAMWAWAAHRALDFAETQSTLDMSRAAVSGHSRLGKTALFAAATDERFKFVHSNESGCSGDALTRGRKGETIDFINNTFGYWFCENYKNHANDVKNMPFDQHYLLAAIAPRKIYISGAEKDKWCDPDSQVLACLAASEMFKQYDATGFVFNNKMPKIGDVFADGDIGYHLRKGTHFYSREDWANFIAFMKKHS